MVGCCKYFGVRILCSCNCWGRSGHDVPVNLQKDKVFLCSATFYLYMIGKILHFKDQNLEKRLSCIILTCNKSNRIQRNRSNMESNLFFPITVRRKKKKNSSLCKREKITIYHIDLRDLRERWCFQAFDTKVLSVTTDERRQE